MKKHFSSSRETSKIKKITKTKIRRDLLEQYYYTVTKTSTNNIIHSPTNILNNINILLFLRSKLAAKAAIASPSSITMAIIVTLCHVVTPRQEFVTAAHLCVTITITIIIIGVPGV